MDDAQIIWDLPDDPDGNYRHIIDGHDVTVEEVEEVLLGRYSDRTSSRSSGYPIAFGWTATGKYIAVVYEEVLDDPLIVRPITAYPVDPP
ncbi:MAG: hypothetical protein K2X82_31095 [Gemmataceae bacterium]|nr:hypothetical protein [Gemmataceae bacterium]